MESAAANEKREWERAFFFDPEDAIYRDHFPGNPVVPGSLITFAFMEAARGIGLSDGPATLSNVRFRKFITPGEYPCTLRLSGKKLSFSLYDGGKVAASGSLLL